jgi:WD40 repeat protein
MRFGDARLRHSSPVTSLALTAAGTRLLTATNTEPVLRLWDVKSGRLLRAVHVGGGADSVRILGITPDARTALIVRSIPQLRVTDKLREWVLVNGENVEWWNEVVALDLPSGVPARWPNGRWPPPVRVSFAVSPDGKALASILDTGEIRVWDVATGADRVLEKLPEPVPSADWSRNPCGICFSPDGRQIAACGGGHALFLAPVDGSGPMQRVPVEGAGASAVYWPLPDRIVAHGGSQMVMVDRTTGAIVSRWRPPDRWVAVGGGRLFGPSLDITAYDAATGSHDVWFLEHRGGSAGAVTPDGRTLALASGHAVDLYDTATGKPLHPDLERAPAQPFAQLNIAPDGSYVFACAKAPLVRSLSDGRELQQPSELPHWLRPDRCVLSPDGRFVYAFTRDFAPAVFEVRTGRVAPLPERDKDGDDLEVVGFAGAGRVWLWNKRKGRLTPVEIGTNRAGPGLAVSQTALRVAVSPDGRKLAAGGRQELSVRDLDSDRGWIVLVEPQRGGPADAFLPVRFSPCGRWLLVSDGTGQVLWDTRTKPISVARFAPIEKHEDQRWDSTFALDGRVVAVRVPARDGGVEWCVWETATGEEVYRLRPTRGIRGFAFTPDGRKLVVSHADTTLSVWDRAALEARLLGQVPHGTEWTWLGSRDAKRAHAAVRALAADPQRALALLTAAYRALDVAVTDRLIADLGDEDFRVRERAQKALTELGFSAHPALRWAATRAESPEVRARAEALLGRTGPASGPLVGERLRAVRAVEVLERIGSPDARALLRTCSAHTDEVLAAESAAALARLATK